jgi:hypothetical protein
MTSARAVDCYCERRTDLSHAAIRKPAEAINEHRDRHALNRVQVDCGPSRDWIVDGLQDYLASQASDSGCAGRDQRPA